MANFVAGALTASLLTEDKKPNIIHNTYVPLSEKQADLYMTTQEYIDQLDTTCKSLFLYIDRNSYYQPKPLVLRSTGERRKITREQAMILVKDEKKRWQKDDKTILMTKGIGGLTKSTIPREKDFCDIITFYIICFPCLPCILYEKWPRRDTPNLENGREGNVKVYQRHFDLLKI
ncbi:MAG: hypothetical protein KR126chlam5_01328 [Candidatus Anoxychlamydiales bacterium]|nr:hypothetical protein [Candidatus Anoxychlamydiales bacterium]